MSESDHTLRIGVLPLDIVQADPEANIRNVENVVERSDTRLPDLIVLPELFSTGFVTDPTAIMHLAEDNSGQTLSRLRQLAATYGVAFAGSFLAKGVVKPANRGFILLPDGRETYYDKHHLFCLSPESHIAEAGGSLPPVIGFRGANLSMVVCYDLRFPAWCRNCGERYDVLLVPANWPTVREYAWRHLLIARAIENQAIVVGANRSGSDLYGDYTGTSCIFDEMGQPVSAPSGPFVTAEISLDKLRRYREKLPVGKDADSFCFM